MKAADQRQPRRQLLHGNQKAQSKFSRPPRPRYAATDSASRPGEAAAASWIRLLLGGAASAQISARKGETASLLAEPADPGEVSAEIFAADLALGALLRSYAFKKYRTTRKPRTAPRRSRATACASSSSNAPSRTPPPRRSPARKAVAEGVFLARDLVNEPANMLGPVEFAERMRELCSAGLEVEMLDVKDQLEALKMGALLAVGQGSERPSRVVRHAVARRQSPSAPRRCASSARACASIPAASP